MLFLVDSNENSSFSFFHSYKACQGSWPSLMFADEDIEPQNFWASSKSHVATTFLCMHFCSNYIGWSNQGKYYEIEVHFAKKDVATWLYDEANIFQFDSFVRKHRPTGWAGWLPRSRSLTHTVQTWSQSEILHIQHA